MKAEIYSHDHARIVYDADSIAEAHDGLLSPQYWQQQQAIIGEARGRGNTVFISAPFGDAALREFRRGGWPARFIRDRYFYLGLDRSRPFREFHLLARLCADGFPVPAPLAAECERHGMFYRGALLTRKLGDVSTLADYLLESSQNETVLERTGSVIRTFHAGGVDHADLNVRNILLSNDQARIYLLDFDRSSYHPGHRVDGDRNNRRLERSVRKLYGPAQELEATNAWDAIMRGYRGQA